MPTHFTRSLYALGLFLAGFPMYALSVGGNVENAHCGLANGSIMAYVTGGTQPYTYVWAPVPAEGQGTPQLMGLLPGAYTLTVTDSMGDEASNTFTVANDPDLLGFTFQYPAQDGHANCPGSCTGQFRVPESYLPGTPPYSYSEPIQGYDQWGEPYFVVPGGACAGEQYAITITDATGCSGVMNIMIAGAQANSPPMAVANITGACSGPSGQGGTVTFENVYDGQFWAPPMVTIDLNGLGQMQQMGEGQTLTFGNLLPGDYIAVRTWEYTAYPCGEAVPFTIPDLGVACGTVSGKVFIDNDGDCEQGPSEVPVPEQVLTVEPGPVYAITAADGSYQVDLGNGSYTLAQNDPTLVQLCPITAPVPFTIADDAQFVDLADSSIIVLDVIAQASNGPARPGFPFSYWLRARNLSPQLSGAVTLTMVYDGQLTHTGSSITPTSTAGTTLTWDLPQLNAYQQHMVQVDFTVPATTPIGTILSGTLTVATSLPDPFPANNTADLSTTVTGSYDPNDKLALTSTRLSDALYFIGQDEWIDYTIRFQNTGTDTAFTVVVTDTLSEALDMGTFQQGVSSFPCTVAFKPERVVEWHFHNILLPDSNTNELASHGLTSFRIRPVQPVLPGTVLSNAANIFFDFNEPVITDPCVLVAEFGTSVPEGAELRPLIAPVPAHDRVVISASGSFATLALHAMDGRKLRDVAVSGPSVTIDLQALPAGAYAVVGTLSDGRSVRGRFIKQ